MIYQQFNIGHGNLPLVKALEWNGSGTGMTTTNVNGIVGGIVDKGMTIVNYNGALLLKTGRSLSVFVNGETEAGKASINVYGYFDRPSAQEV